MDVAVAVVIWAGIGVLLLLGIVMILPVRVDLVLSAEPGWQARVRIRPLAGLGPPLKLYDSGKARDRGKRSSAKPHRATARPRNGMSTVLAVRDLGLGLLRQVRVDSLRVDAAFGTGDPAETGQVYGLLTPVIHGTAAGRAAQINIRPMFDVRGVQGTARARLSLVPVQLLPPLLRFGWRIWGRER